MSDLIMGLDIRREVVGAGRLIYTVLWGVLHGMKPILPVVRVLGRILEIIFIPRIVLKQLLMLLVLQIGYEMSGNVWRGLRYAIWTRFTKTGKKAASLHTSISQASTYAEFRRASLRLSQLLVQNKTTKILPSEQHALRLLQSQNHAYKSLIAHPVVSDLRHLLRSDLLRPNFKKNAEFMKASSSTSPELQSAIKLNQELISKALMLLVKDSPQTLSLSAQLSSLRERISFFNETLQSFGNSALMLSGGATLGFLHVGVIKALYEQKLLPKVLSGSSAGSIVCALVGSCTDAELERLFLAEDLNLRFFGREDSALDMFMNQPQEQRQKQPQLTAVNRVFTALLPQPLQQYFHLFRKLLPDMLDKKSFMDTKILQKAIRDHIGDTTFLEAFLKTGRVINISVTEHHTTAANTESDFPKLLNYLTTPDIVIWSAAAASCSLPGVFEPASLYKKENGEIVECVVSGVKWKDGSLESDLPTKRIRELFDVNHFIVSQVNPHARVLAPHLKQEFEGYMPMNEAKYWNWMWKHTGKVIMFLRDQLRSYVKHLADIVYLTPLLTQKYHGDVTITRRVRYEDIRDLLRNPSREKYKLYVEEGERMAFPHIAQIRQRCLMEFMLADCLSTLKRKEKKLERLLIDHYTASERGRKKVMREKQALEQLKTSLITRVVSTGNLADLHVNSTSSSSFKAEETLETIKEEER